jgi:membrane protease YdiL (CAAX protease family)
MLSIPALLPSIYPWFFLVSSLIAAFIKPKLWPLGLLCTLMSGLFYNAIDVVGLGVVTLLFIMAYYAKRLSTKPSRNSWNQKISLIIALLVIMSCIALAAHLLPGFNNLQVLSNEEKSINSMPFSLYLNFDKPMIIFVLLILSPTVLMNNKKVILFKVDNKLRLSAMIFATFFIIFGLADLLSLISIEPSLPHWWWLFALNNLFLTCVVEEVFFRGIIQHQLTKMFSPIGGLMITSLLFGAAHLAGGLDYVLISTLAGFIYGFVYLNTGKIWHSILIHFSLNIIHLSLFTYPLLKV